MNCVSGGISSALLPHSGVIHHSLQRAHARNLWHVSCKTAAAQHTCCSSVSMNSCEQLNQHELHVQQQLRMTR